MMGEINQGNVHLLLPSKVSRLAVMLSEGTGVSLIEAIRRIYASKLYRDLQDESTKKWWLGPVDLYRELMEECGAV